MDLVQTQILLDSASFNSHVRAIGVRSSPERTFVQLAHCYAESHRAYHDAEHIAECLAWLGRCREHAERPDELAIALYFHDAVYDPIAPDNEARSAALFLDLARDAGAPAEVAARIATLIEATATHSAALGDAALMNDIDLAILGASPHRYAEYEAGLRREYAAFGEDAYRAGRAALLRGFLERIALYQTPRMFALLEVQARDNLRRALAALSPDAGVADLCERDPSQGRDTNE